MTPQFACMVSRRMVKLSLRVDSCPRSNSWWNFSRICAIAPNFSDWLTRAYLLLHPLLVDYDLAQGVSREPLDPGLDGGQVAPQPVEEVFQHLA